MPTNALIRGTLATTWALCGLGILLLAIRAVLILRRRSSASWEFGWIVSSTGLSLAFQVLIVLVVRLGAGLHVDQINVNNILPAINLFFIMCSLGVATVCTAKLAVVALLWTMDPPTKSRKWRASLILTSVFLVALAVAQIALVEISRRKIKTLVDLVNHDSITVLNDSFDFAYGFGAFSGLVDLYLTIYPALLVLSNCDSKVTQAVAMAPIMLGVIPIVAAVTRTIAFHRITAGDDVTYNAAIVLLCFSAEYGSTVILVSVFPIGIAVKDMVHGYPARDSRVHRDAAGGDIELIDAQLLEKKPAIREARSPDPGFDKAV